MIKTSYDPERDAMFIWLAPESTISVETKEVSPGVMLDYGCRRPSDRDRDSGRPATRHRSRTGPDRG
jgi:hypothetical protein